MIRPDVQTGNINMAHARRLIDACVGALPKAVTLYVFHEGGWVMRAWHSVRGRIDIDNGPIEPSLELAARLSIEYEATDVQIIDLGVRDRFLRESQDLDQVLEMNGTDYKLWVHEMKWRMGPGMILYPKREFCDRFVYTQRAKDFARKKLSPDAVFLLGVTEGEDWWTSLTVLFEKGEIVRFTTFDDLPEPWSRRPQEGRDGRARGLADLAAAHYGKKAHVLILDRETFGDLGNNAWSGLGEIPLAVSGEERHPQ